MNKVQLFQDRLLTDAEQLALATGAAAYRREDLTKAPVSPSLLLNPRRYGDGAKDLFITLNCVQENIIRGGQRDRSRRQGAKHPWWSGAARKLQVAAESSPTTDFRAAWLRLRHVH
jgi:soluble lytic murein transglycosylase-like protein